MAQRLAQEEPGDKNTRGAEQMAPPFQGLTYPCVKERACLEPFQASSKLVISRIVFVQKVSYTEP